MVELFGLRRSRPQRISPVVNGLGAVLAVEGDCLCSPSMSVLLLLTTSTTLTCCSSPRRSPTAAHPVLEAHSISTPHQNCSTSPTVRGWSASRLIRLHPMVAAGYFSRALRLCRTKSSSATASSQGTALRQGRGLIFICPPPATGAARPPAT
jgi:hypothetical protein